MGNKLEHKIDRDFTLVPNLIFRDKRLTLKAKGLWCLIISLPDGWNFSVKGLATMTKDNEYAIRAGLKELEDFGYLVWQKSRINNQKFAVKVTSTLPIFTDEEITHVEITHVKTNNNKERNNKELNNKELKEDIAQAENQGQLIPLEPKRQRNRDLLFEAICHVCKIDWTKLTKSGRGELNRAKKELEDVGATPEEVLSRAKIYRSKFSVATTPSGLAKHWAGCTPEAVTQIVTEKERNKKLGQYQSGVDHQISLDYEKQKLIAQGVIDEEGNYIKRRELEDGIF